MGRPFVEENERRVIFMKHMYKCSGRDNPDHAMHGLYTGLWHDFCINEAGLPQRDLWFERMQFVKDVEDKKINPDGSLAPGFTRNEKGDVVSIDPVDQYFECVTECKDEDEDCKEECVTELKEPVETTFDNNVSF